MYDQNALELISNAPQFGEIDFNQLPKDFTKAYTLIVSARLRHRTIHGEADADITELLSLKKEVSRLAHTYEAYVLLHNEDGNNRKAAAFIAASAHSLLSEMSTIIDETAENPHEPLSDLGIDRNLSAAFMYFLANYTADAIEMVKKVEITDSSTSKGRLLGALHQLLTGQIGSIDDNVPLYPATDTWSLITASDALWAYLHEGVNVLLKTLTYVVHDSNEGFSRALARFERVIELSSYDQNIDIGDINAVLEETYIGQKYLAMLLKAITTLLPDIALISLDVPSNTNPDDWYGVLATFAKKRPYLWPNHLSAIESGYLNKGVSSVISFPTGGGKSTLSELKIATSLLRHESIIFLAPTLALVDQVAKSLKDAFPLVRTSVSFDEFGGISIEREELPDISVMTPESCLVKMSFAPELFAEVGLFVFDECHLLHSKDRDIVNRRSLDAMLCLLKIIELSPDTDLLLMSAMLSNGHQMADWLITLLNKTVLPLNLSWKPTRQAKGCVVYNADQIRRLEQYISSEAPRTNGGRLTAPAQRELTTTPYGFFSLNQTWHSNNIQDYKLTKFLDSPILLGVNDFSRLTANRNQVAASLAKAATASDIKTLIFTSNRKDCVSIATTLNQEDQNNSTTLTEYEDKLYRFVLAEFGGENFTYFTSVSKSLPHHGLLLKEERLLHEALFKRTNSNINTLVATSTLAQGINLPAEYVIIAGDSRFDQETNRQQTLEAHELLNAAGRAGRAGQNASGVVLVIPSKVISFDPSNTRITNHWRKLQSIFEQSDQCLEVEDPIGHILDRIQAEEGTDASDIKYFTQSISSENVTRIVNKSFRAFIERSNGHENWVSERIATAQEAIFQIASEQNEACEDWIRQLSSVSGIASNLIQILYDDFVGEISSSTINDPFTVLNWFFTWLCESFTRANAFIRMHTLDEEIGSGFSSMNDNSKLAYIRDHISVKLRLWMIGRPLEEIERSFGPASHRLNKCYKARSLVIRIVPELAYATNILIQIYKHHLEINPASKNLHIELLPQMIRLGFDNPQKLALHYILKDETCRINTHSLYNLIVMDLPIDDTADFNQLLRNVRDTYLRFMS